VNVFAFANVTGVTLGGYFGSCPGGPVTAALTGCVNWTAVTLTQPLSTSPASYTFSYAAGRFDGAAIGTRNLCFAAGIANTPTAELPAEMSCDCAGLLLGSLSGVRGKGTTRTTCNSETPCLL
jgi:hypothetical protein